MAQFEYDPLDLIKEVKKRPELWKVRPSEKCVKPVWFELAKTLTRSRKFTDHELKIIAQQCSNAWFNIKCQSKYYDYLTFLPEVATNSSNEISSMELDKSATNASQANLLNKVNSQVDQPSLSKRYTTALTEATYSLQNTPKTKRYSKRLNRNDIIIDSDSDSSESGTPVAENVLINGGLEDENQDPDMLFLLSLVPELKSLPDDSKITVKMKIMHAIQNAMYERRI